MRHLKVNTKTTKIKKSKSKGQNREMNRQCRASLRVLLGACLVLALCLQGSAERGGSNRPRSGGSSRSTSVSSSGSSRRSTSSLDDDFLDLDDNAADASFLFDDDNDVGYGLDGQDDLDYLEDSMDGIDFSEGDDDFDEGREGDLFDDAAEDDGDGHQSSSTEKGALYDAYNLLHSLAQVSFGMMSYR